jgi:hypothetical protein
MHKTESIFKPKNILRFPRLDTVLMIENTIRTAKEHPTKAELIRSLPKKIMYQKFNLIIDYLEYSGKIYINPDNKRIVWIWNPEIVEKYLKKPELHWRH